jgi:hypothetical protein
MLGNSSVNSSSGSEYAHKSRRAVEIGVPMRSEPKYGQSSRRILSVQENPI